MGIRPSQSWERYCQRVKMQRQFLSRVCSYVSCHKIISQLLPFPSETNKAQLCWVNRGQHVSPNQAGSELLTVPKSHPFAFLVNGHRYFCKFLCCLLFFFLIYFCLHWVFVAAHGFSLVAASGGYSSLRCGGFSLRWLLLLRSTGSRRAGFSSCGTRAQ